MADDINLGVRVNSEFKSLISDLKGAGAQTKALTQQFDKLVAQVTQLNTAMAASTAAVKKNTAASTATVAGKTNEYNANKRLIQQQTLFNQLYGTNGPAAQKKYLSNLTGLRESLSRFRQETSRIMVLEKGHISLLDEQTNSMKRFMIQGNMVTTALDNMAARSLNMGKNMQWTGRQMMVGITMPLLGIGAATLKFAKASGEVDRQLKRVVEGGEKSLKVLHDSAVELSNTWGMNVEQVKALQVEFAQAGFNTSSIKNLTRQTQEFSVVGDVAVESAHSLVQALALTGKQGSDLTDTLAKLNLIDDETSLSMQGVADALPKIVPIFKAYGGTVEQAAALLAGFTDNSIDAVEGANSLKAVLTKVTPAMSGLSGSLIPGTRLVGLRQALTTMQEMTGINLGLVDSHGKLRNSLDVLIQLAAATNEMRKSQQGMENLSPIMRELFGAQQGARGIALMTELGEALQNTTGNANGLAKAMEIANATGQDLVEIRKEYERQINITQDDPWMKFQQSVQKLRNVAIDFGLNQVLPVAQDLLEKITGLIDRFSRLSKGTKDMIVKIALAAMTLGPLIYGLGQFVIMGSTITQMVFTKPLKALFHMGRHMRNLASNTSDASEAIDKLMSSYLANEIDRVALKKGVETELHKEAMRRADEKIKAQGNIKGAIDETTESVLRQADELKNAGTVGTVGASNVAARAKLGPMHGPAAPQLGLDAIKKQYPDIYNKVVGYVPGARDALDPELKPILDELNKRVRVDPKIYSPLGLKNAKTSFFQTRRDLRLADKALQPKFLDPVLAGMNMEFEGLRNIATKAGENERTLKATRSRFEKYVPLLIKHSDISVSQLDDAKELERIIGGIEKHLPKNQYGAPISSATNIKKVLANSQIAGPNSLNIRETFPGQRALRSRAETLVSGMRSRLVEQSDFKGADKLMPRGMMNAFSQTYKDYVITAIMEDTDGSLIEGVNQQVRDKIAQLKGDLGVRGADGSLRPTPEFSDKFWKLAQQSKTLGSNINSKYATHISDIFDRFRSDPAEAKKLSTSLLRKLKITGGKDKITQDLLQGIASEVAQGKPMGEILRSGKIPRSVLNEVASTLFTGDDLGSAVTRIYKEAGLVKKVDPSKTVKAMKEQGFSMTQIRNHVKRAKQQTANDRAAIARVLEEVQDELLRGAGVDSGTVNRLRQAGKGWTGVKGFVPGWSSFDELEEQIGRGDVQGWYERKMDSLTKGIEENSRKKAESMREYRQRVGRIRRRETTRLIAERDKLAKAFQQAKADLDRISTTFDPSGQLMLDGKPTTQAAIDDLRRQMVQKAYDSPERQGVRQRITTRANQLIERRNVARPSTPTIPQFDIPTSSMIEGPTQSVKKLNRTFDTLRGTGGKLVGRGGILSTATWTNAGTGIAGTAAKTGRLARGFKGVGDMANQAVAAMTGMTIAGQGGMATMLAPALPIIAVLAAIAGAIYLIWKNWDEVGPYIVDGLKAIKDAAKNVFDAFVGPFKTVFNLMDEGGAKGKSMSETWQTVGVLINRSLTAVATVLNVIAPIVGVVAKALAALSYVLISLFNAFGKLPGAVQLAVAAFALLQFAGVRAAIGALIDKLAILVFNLAGVPATARAAAAGMTALQAAAGFALIGLTAISMGIQSIKQAQQDGINTSNEYWASLQQDYGLGPQQRTGDALKAWQQAKDEYDSLMKEATELEAQQGNSFGDRAARAFGALPGVSTGSDDLRKRVEELNARLEDQRNKMNGLSVQYETQVKTVNRLKRAYGLTESQIIEFAKANQINLTGKTQDVLDRFRDKWQQIKEDGGDPIPMEVDTGQVEAANDKLAELEATWSTMRTQIGKVMDGWKQAALEGFDKWADQQVKGIDDQIDALRRLTKAEEEELRNREYLRRKEELALKRRELQTNYIADRSAAIAAGNYDEAATMDMDYERDNAEIDKEISQHEEDHQRELTRLARDAESERLSDLKEAKRLELQETKTALQRQLDAITEFAPRNAEAAASMQQQILNAMGQYTGKYGEMATTQHELWKNTWGSAWEDTKAIVADDAWWAGRAALEGFWSGLGGDVTQLAADTPPSTRPGGAQTGSPRERFEGVGGRPAMPIRHTGGTIGSIAASPQDIDATLQTGEFVVQRKAVAKYGTGLLNALNEGQIYHAGGIVNMAGAARAGMRTATKNATDNFFAGGTLNGTTWENVKNAYQNSLGGGMGGSLDVAGKSIAEIVDNLVKGIHPEFQKRLEKWNAEMGGRFNITRGYRNMASQQYLYNRWINRVPGQAPAAPPGKSMHNFGLAVDLLPASTTAAQRAAGAKYGIRWPMSYEPWHVEPNEAKDWRASILGGAMPGGGGMNLPTGNFALRQGLFGAAGVGTGIGTSGGDPKSIVRGMLNMFGWGDDQWPSLEKLVQGESSWNPNADNPTSSAAGLFQKMTSIHGPIEPTVQGQAQWGLNYIKGRYGNPSAAYAKWLSRNPHWYHTGGLAQLKEGGQTLSDGVAKLHKSETVLTQPLSQELIDGIRNMNSGGTVIKLEIGQFIGSDREIEKLGRELERVMNKVNRAKGNSPRTFSGT